jgi:hypothetical protein
MNPFEYPLYNIFTTSINACDAPPYQTFIYVPPISSQLLATYKPPRNLYLHINPRCRQVAFDLRIEDISCSLMCVDIAFVPFLQAHQ